MPRRLLFAVAVSAALPAQNVLHYKFDEHCGAEVVNFAGSTTGNAAIHTVLPGGPDAARIVGRFDQALSGTAGTGTTTYLTTGWAPATATGSFSFAMWIRNHPGNPSAIGFGYLFGAQGGNFRVFTGSSGKLFLSGVPGSATSAANLTTLLNAGWVHAACTVDGTTNQATWYIDGVADPTVTMTQGVALAGTDFAMGARDTGGSSASPLDTDEFLFAETLWTPAEVLALSQNPPAADGGFTSGVPSQCGAGNVVLGSAGGKPFAGNPSYALTVATATPSLFLLLVGLDRCTFGGAVPLPLDGTPLLPLLNGCWIVTDAPVILNGVAAGAPVTLPLAIPGTVPNSVAIYTQALGLDLATGASSMSNGFASSVGS